MNKELNMALIESLAGAAAHWWAERVNGSIAHDNGSNEIASLIVGALADGLSVKPDEQQIRLFEEKLKEKIIAKVRELREQAERHYVSSQIYLSCDYQPSTTLTEAAEESGIYPGNFPWKTSSCIDLDKGSFTASAGYRQPWVQIFPEKSENDL